MDKLPSTLMTSETVMCKLFQFETVQDRDMNYHIATIIGMRRIKIALYVVYFWLKKKKTSMKLLLILSFTEATSIISLILLTLEIFENIVRKNKISYSQVNRNSP